MHVITFDTLEYTEQLKAAGIPEEHAKGHAKALALVIKQVDTRTDEQAARHDKQVDERLDSLTEKSEKQMQSRLDGLATKQEMDYRLAVLETNLKRDMKEMELRMVIKMGAMILASVGMIIGYLRAFPMPVQIVQPPAQEMRQMAPSPALPVPPGAPVQPAR
ncbi:MAG: hypothetical protein HQL88_10200 [Magnetococcales bacterium]|nr:hypothetical protein [Magnetococcales bacterium]